MDLNIILSFWGTAFLLAIMPGPDNLYVLAESLTRGRNTGIFLSLGLSSGVIVHTLAVMTGVAVLLKESPLAFTLVQYLGAFYLLYLAYQTTKEKAIEIDTNQAQKVEVKSKRQLMKKGFFMNVLNPKVLLFFIALFPQFVKEGTVSAEIQILILGGLFMITAFGVFTCIAILADQFTHIINKPKFWIIAKWSKIAVLIVLSFLVIL